MIRMTAPRKLILTAIAATALIGASLPGLASAESCRAQKNDKKRDGAIAGAVVGGVIGGSASDTRHKGVGTVLGAVVGAAVGSSIAKNNSKCRYDYGYNDDNGYYGNNDGY